MIPQSRSRADECARTKSRRQARTSEQDDQLKAGSESTSETLAAGLAACNGYETELDFLVGWFF